MCILPKQKYHQRWLIGSVCWRPLYLQRPALSVCYLNEWKNHVQTLNSKRMWAERNTVLTWYCGLYQCFRSQSHKIIWKTEERHISCQPDLITACVSVHNGGYEMHFTWREHGLWPMLHFQPTVLWPFNEGTGRSATSCLLLVYSACYLNTRCSNSLH